MILFNLGEVVINKMICILGKSASGKNTIVDELIKKYNLKKIISYTSRNIQIGEKENFTYKYITKKDFIDKLNKGFFAEYKTCDVGYGSIYYGIAKEDLFFSKDSVCILPPDRFKVLKNNIKKSKKIKLDITSFYIECNETNRIKRLLNRGEKIDEILRKEKEEESNFKDIEFDVDFVIANNGLLFIESIADMIFEATIGKEINYSAKGGRFS